MQVMGIWKGASGALGRFGELARAWGQLGICEVNSDRVNILSDFTPSCRMTLLRSGNMRVS